MFTKGDKVAWTMSDGDNMAGTIDHVFYDRAFVTRVDGSLCTMPLDKLRRATDDDILSACDWFKTLGK